MKNHYPAIRYSVLLLIGFAATPLLTQASGLTLRGPIAFETFDKDSNGMISPQEFVSTHNQRKRIQFDAGMRPKFMPGFTYFDANGDNQISKEELAAGRENWRQQRGNMQGQKPGSGMGPGMGRGQGMGQGMNRGRNMPSFADFDLNGDGVLKPEEFYDARAKRMYQRAEQGYPMRNAAKAPPFEQVDTNKDGVISTEEFAAHQAEHKRMRGNP
ncbi:MAG: EF-hand domain-containing protein [Gammaproteobacteria bacterium]|nr:EF-hand domain-containing protein [Gammaproteobacteria bacterium]